MTVGPRASKLTGLRILPLLIVATVSVVVAQDISEVRHFKSVAAADSGEEVSSFTSMVMKAAPGGCGAASTILARLEEITGEEVRNLNDPFGQRVFRAHPTELRLQRILELLKEGADQSHSIFVVREWIKQSDAARLPRNRRCVLALDGSLASRVMISFGFDADRFPEVFGGEGGEVELWGWDRDRNQFHFYEVSEVDGREQWVHAGSSPRPTDEFPFTGGNRCMQCHVNGAPIMKELKRPWNNWESSTSPNAYLDRNSPAAWPAPKNSAFYRLNDAQNLQPRIESAIKRYAREIVDASAVPDNGGTLVKNLPRLLRHLFLTTEFNLVSSQEESGLTPFGPGTIHPDAKVEIPNGFFLNADVLAGLQVPEANQFSSKATFRTQIYAELVRNRQLQMKAQRGDNELFELHKGFDCNFPWFVPEPALIDTYMVERMLNAGILTPELVAAVQLVDLRNPVFSEIRRMIYETSGLIPESVKIPDGTNPSPDHRDHPLTRHMIERLDELNPLPGSPLGEFRAILGSRESPLERLRDEVSSYLSEVAADFDDAQADRAAIEEWFDLLLERRSTVLRDPVLSALDETRDNGSSVPRSEALLPLP